MNFDCDTNVVEVSIRRLRAKIDDPPPETETSTRSEAWAMFLAVNDQPPSLGNSSTDYPAPTTLTVKF